MRVKVVIGDAEVREAVRQWAEQHGIPNTIVDKLVFRGVRQGPPSGNEILSAIDVTVEYEAESLSKHDGEPVISLEEVQRVKRKL